MLKYDIRALDNFCAEQDIRLILLDTDIKELEKRYIIRGDEHIKISQLQMLKDRYDAFSEITKLPVLKLDTRKENWMAEVEKFIQKSTGDL